MDFSPVAVAAPCEQAAAEGWDDGLVSITTDLVPWMATTQERYDLVLGCYMHGIDAAITSAAGLLSPGGHLLWILHAPDSPHGPPPQIRRPSAEEVFAEASALDCLTDVRVETVLRDECFSDTILTAVRQG